MGDGTHPLVLDVLMGQAEIPAEYAPYFLVVLALNESRHVWAQREAGQDVAWPLPDRYAGMVEKRLGIL